MYTEQPKKLLIIYILKILQKYSDEDHKLSQKNIQDKLLSEYGVKVDRKAVKRNLADLIELNDETDEYSIEYKDTVRLMKNKKTGEPEESHVLSDFYILRNFTDGELRLLIDSVLFSSRIPSGQCNELVEKLGHLSSTHFLSKIPHIERSDCTSGDNMQIFLNIQKLDEAISRKKKVAFKYLEYRTDKKQYPRKRSNGSEEYVISPYQMAAREGNCFLICNLDKYDNIANYRIDRMKDIEILEKENVKPFEKLRGANGQKLDLSEYMKKHAYMYSGEDCRATLKIKRSLLNDFIDKFGKDVTFFEEDANEITVSLNTNKMSILQFAQRYVSDVVILNPKEMSDEMKNTLKLALDKYNLL